MEILKQGDLSRTIFRKKFECDRCGCVFVADDTEYKNAPYLACAKDGIKYECKCPTCKATVYR